MLISASLIYIFQGTDCPGEGRAAVKDEDVEIQRDSKEDLAYSEITNFHN